MGIYIQARAVCLPGRQPGPDTAVLLTVKDGLLGGEVGADGQMTFTFWYGHPFTVRLGGVTLHNFQNMAQQFWQELPIIQSVYQARTAYITATSASPVQAMPNVEDKADSMPYQWFTGNTLPETNQTYHQYSQPMLVEMVNIYNQWADDGV